eukprot:11745275-Ditylum_brightwellii.AAC.1
MDALATSVQEQLSTNQNSLQQMMQEQRNHLDAKIIVLLDSLQNMRATTEKNCKAIIAIKNQFSANSDGPHNKRQKYSNEDAGPVEVMEDTDALCRNRDAWAPDPLREATYIKCKQ